MRINPQDAVVLLHTGGRAGNFLAGMINSHPGFINQSAVELSNNRYSVNIDNLILDTNSSRGPRLCFHAHATHKDFRNSVFVKLASSPRYDVFYHAMFWLKTNIGYNIISDSHFNRLVDPHTMFKTWLPQSQLLMYEDLDLHYRIDLDQLFFGSTADEYQKFCNFLDITPNLSNIGLIQQYHQRNVELLVREFKIGPEQLCDLTLDHQIAMFANVIAEKIQLQPNATI